MAEHGPAAARSNTTRSTRRLLAEEPETVTTQRVKINTNAVTGSAVTGRSVSAGASRKPSVLQMARTGRGLSATACCCTEPCSPTISHPWARSHCALVSRCPRSELCLVWVGMEGEASPTLIFLVVLALSYPSRGYHRDIPGC